jgi:glycosyltransferase involved in cell wall biosynthesis
MTNVMEKLISIVIPTYNMERYLAKCLNTLVISEENMKFLEVLVINDGSKDASSRIAHEFEDKYPATFRVIDKENGNYGSCVNRGLQEAKGKYIKVLDADDYFSCEKFNGYVDFLKGTDADLIITDYNIVDTNGEISKKVTFSIPTSRPCTFDDIPKAECQWIWHHALTYKTDNLREINYRQTEGISYTDEEWVFKPMVKAETLWYYPYAIYMYLRGREGQTYDPAVLKKDFGQIYQVTEELLDYYLKWETRVGENRIVSTYLQDGMIAKLALIYRLYLMKLATEEGNSKMEGFDRRLKCKSERLYQWLGDCPFKFGFRYVGKWRESGYRKNTVSLVIYRFIYHLALHFKKKE